MAAGTTAVGISKSGTTEGGVEMHELWRRELGRQNTVQRLQGARRKTPLKSSREQDKRERSWTKKLSSEPDTHD